VGGVIVVEGGDRVRDVLIPVYDALGLAWDPATVGALADEVPGLAWADAVVAVERAFAERFGLEPGTIPDDIVAEALDLSDRFVPQIGGDRP
jgi:hypothetical protein